MFEQRITPWAACAALAMAGTAAAEDSAEADNQEEEDGKYVETIVVTGERGEVNVLDRPMTVTGFNAAMIEQLGVQNADDLEVLVPGLQVGNRTQGGGKNEDDHYYMRGIGSERTVNFFSDTSVAVYIDGVWTDQTYATDGLFDVERVEVARGPQGTTGGRAAIAGAINFHTRKPTDEFDLRVKGEFTDVFTQRYQVAFGGPIKDTGLSYRLGLSRYTGEGKIENIGSSGIDAAKPDQTIIAPQLRWKNDRLDVTMRYSRQTDTGTPYVSLPLGARNTRDEFVLDPGGNPICDTDPITGLEVCQRNPYFGANAAPSVANCSNINNDGTRDEMNIICNPDELQWKVAFNAPIYTDNYAESTSLEAAFALTENLEVVYKYGWRDVSQDNLNDADQLDRQGGGVCPFNHPKVLNGPLQAGQNSPWCALDGGGIGTFFDSRVNYIFTSEQVSHEVTLISDFDGAFNFTVGAVYLDGEEPYFYKNWDYGSARNDWAFADTSAQCEAVIESLYGAGGSRSGGTNALLRDVYTNADAMAAAPSAVFGCPGSPEVVNYSHTGVEMFTADLNGHNNSFFGNTAYTSRGVYFNAEYVLNDTWKVFGGLRNDSDRKDHKQNSFASTFALHAADLSPCTQNDCTDGIAFVNIALRDSSIAGFEGKGDASWGKTTWNAGVEYSLNEDVMVYGRLSTGYRAGGFLGYGRTAPPWNWDAEEVMNYELGVKGVYFNGLQLSATVFYQDFENYWVYASRLRTPAEVQISPFAGPTTDEVSPIEGTTIKGLELEGAWRLNDQFTLRGFYNYLDTNIGPFLSLYPFEIPGRSSPWQQLPWTDADGNARTTWIRAAEEEYGGGQLPNQPKHKASLTLAYNVPLSGRAGNLELLTIANYRSKKYVELANIEAYAVDPYVRWDLRAIWRSSDSPLEITAYVQNVLDKAALHMWSPREGAASPWGTMVEPREIGLSGTWRM